ncbi:DUF1573 domain-containing protein [Riemerella anatipestifer]|uniref:DUF1573 domain-containing protein n=1 Tax=Riemerella anatipestifer TaxID=34085 RepID=UPI00069B84AD|nr:DUF1573 domain-containing protein [Riemerella anatipestifer]MBO4233677.1 DUF1573 domain-containing protein [Riemerella anatipestifer]MDY3344756.1 DUF1573 domain-containing protein [Riemerella anatipestifer]MDY3358097.1 DUF1573 domain-containing protein [Riemerella anatipestifer]
MRKITKITALLGFSVLSLTACNKNEKPEVLNSETEVAEQISVEEQLHAEQSDMVKQAQSSPLTSVALSAPSFDFGVVKSGSIVEHTYEITNTGKNPLIISNVKPTCGCTVPDYTKEPILPGKVAKVTLKFDSGSFQGMQQKFVEVYANTEKTPIVLSFTADVQ